MGGPCMGQQGQGAASQVSAILDEGPACSLEGARCRVGPGGLPRAGQEVHAACWLEGGGPGSQGGNREAGGSQD
eukprot:2325545-Heterocapsa_arctica.AAC.1